MTAALGSSGGGAVELESSLLAPCCYNGTLITHESDLARSLRAEIEQRVAQGEPTTSIRADMVERYGEKVLALPNKDHFTDALTLAGLIAAVVTVVVLLRLRKWTAARPERVAPQKARDEYDDRIDHELESID